MRFFTATEGEETMTLTNSFRENPKELYNTISLKIRVKYQYLNKVNKNKNNRKKSKNFNIILFNAI